jgi:ketosteroid isomerase-like protein
MFVLVPLVACVTPMPAVAKPGPQAAVDGLLAADRQFAARGGAGLAAALAAMFDTDVIMPQPGGKFVRGRDAAVAAITALAGNAGAKATWTPVRGGVSADGRHGFTFGYMTVTRADGTAVALKYLAYWIRRAEGWRVAAYKRAGRPAGEVSTAPLAPSLPARLVAPTTDAKTLAAHRASLVAAEQAFSDRAQRVGLAAAFASTGWSDAMNMGAGPAFTIGAQAIGAGFDAGRTSPLKWNADDAIVASSGDLGVTFGLIRSNEKPDQPPFAFFTVWRREGAGDWRYIAE